MSFNAMVDELASTHGSLTEVNRTLEARVDERTTDLAMANSQLEAELAERRIAEKARRSAEGQLETQRAGALRSDRLRSLGEMAAGIAHELNQPLVGVRGLAEHLLISYERNWDLDQERVKDRLERIVAQADRMTHIIEHVRMFAREAGKPEVSAVHVNEVVKSSIEMLVAQFRAHDVELIAEPADDLPAVLANFYSLEEVLLNLLNNARDVLVEGGGQAEEAS